MARSVRRSILYVGAASAALVLLSGSLVASAAIPNSATGVITGCRNIKTGALSVIDAQAGKKCPSTTKVLTWNQTGPAGVQGLPGPTGPQGPQGVAGPPGSSPFYVASDSTPVMLGDPNTETRVGGFTLPPNVNYQFHVVVEVNELLDSAQSFSVECNLESGLGLGQVLIAAVPDFGGVAQGSIWSQGIIDSVHSISGTAGQAETDVRVACFVSVKGGVPKPPYQIQARISYMSATPLAPGQATFKQFS